MRGIHESCDNESEDEININILRHGETNTNSLLATGVFTSAELFRLSKGMAKQFCQNFS